MILIAVGSNLPGDFASPRQSCLEALRRLEAAGIKITARSRWWKTAPVPASDQPWFVNGVIAVAAPLPSTDLLARLHAVEEAMGRIRTIPNAARIIDLDLIAYNDEIRDAAPCLPHPRAAQRAFVLYPLADVAPQWRHPLNGLSVEAMIAALPPGQETQPEAI